MAMVLDAPSELVRGKQSARIAIIAQCDRALVQIIKGEHLIEVQGATAKRETERWRSALKHLSQTVLLIESAEGMIRIYLAILDSQL